MLKHRLPSALLLTGIVILAVTLDGWPGQAAFLIFGLLVIALATGEFIGLLRPLDLAPPRRWVVALVMIGFALEMLLPERHLLVAWIAWLLVGLLLAWGAAIIATDRVAAIKSVIGAAAAVALIFIPLNCLTLIYLHETPTVTGRHLLLTLLLITKSGDIGGYVCGTLTARMMPGGNHKMIPRLSPKKSWEGFVGGLLLSLAMALVLRCFLPVAEDSQTVTALALGALFYVGGLMGDLSISALKRAANAKDSGRLIPGMGGMLDVIDSLLINAPIAWLLLLLS